MKLTLVSLHCDRSPQAFPLAAAMLTAQVPADIETRLIDIYPDEPVELSISRILESDPSILGFSVYLWNVDSIQRIAAEIHRRNPRIILIAGGPEVTADADNFDPEGRFTALFAGEGEEILKTFLALKPAEITRRTTGRIFRQQAALDVTTLGSPFLKKIINISLYDGILWELSRGCVFNCSFCFESRGIRKVRDFPLEVLTEELDYFVSQGVSQIFILDPTFNLNPERAKTLLRLFREKAPDIHFTFEIRSEFLDREMAELFSDLTCSIQLGLQSIHPEVLRKVNRQFNRRDFYDKILLLHEAGAVYGFDLIYGLPGDTYDGFCESLDFALSLRPNHLDIFPLAVLKGTELYNTAAKYNIVYSASNPYTVLHTPGFSEHDIKKAEKLARACSLFYNRGEAVPWFSMFLEALDETPSSLLTDFSMYFEKNKLEHIDFDMISILEITVLQKDYIYSRFTEKSLEREGSAAADIIQWFNGISFLNAHEMETSLTLDFNFNIETMIENIEMGIDSLEELAHFTEMTSCRGKLYKDGGEVFTRIIESDSNL